jgi:hypothetical protein
MQADVQKRRPVCFLQHFHQCFPGFRLSDSPRIGTALGQVPMIRLQFGRILAPKLSPFSESLGKRGYTEVAIESGAWTEKSESRQNSSYRRYGIAIFFDQCPSDLAPVCADNDFLTFGGQFLNLLVLRFHADTIRIPCVKMFRTTPSETGSDEP